MGRSTFPWSGLDRARSPVPGSSSGAQKRKTSAFSTRRPPCGRRSRTMTEHLGLVSWRRPEADDLLHRRLRSHATYELLRLCDPAGVYGGANLVKEPHTRQLGKLAESRRDERLVRIALGRYLKSWTIAHLQRVAVQAPFRIMGRWSAARCRVD